MTAFAKSWRREVRTVARLCGRAIKLVHIFGPLVHFCRRCGRLANRATVLPQSRRGTTAAVANRRRCSILEASDFLVRRARQSMLSVWTRTFRVKAAIVLAALYAACVLAPAAAFAFSNNPTVAHCLTEGHVGVHDHASMHDHNGKVHVHADGTAHKHHDDSAATPPSGDDRKAIATCCTLFSAAAIAGEPAPTLGFDNLAYVILPVLGDALIGRGPERINRPPIA